MLRRALVLAVLVVAVFSAFSAPAAADDGFPTDKTSCVKFKTDPPSVVVDIGCVTGGIPPEPGP